MSENTSTPEITETEITEGKKAYLDYIKKMKQNKRIRQAAFITVTVVAVALSLKYIATPVSDEDENSEDE